MIGGHKENVLFVYNHVTRFQPIHYIISDGDITISIN